MFAGLHNHSPFLTIVQYEKYSSLLAIMIFEKSKDEEEIHQKLQ